MAEGVLPDGAFPLGAARLEGWALRKISRVERHGAALPAVPGFDCAVPPGTLLEAGGVWLACLAPGEWLQFGATLPELADDPAFLVVDLSDGRLLLRLDAALGEKALAAYCPLDPAVDLAPGRVARSLLADADALFARAGEGLLLMTDISIADHVAALLARLEP